MRGPWVWVSLAALTGFAGSTLFSSWLRWPRDRFVLGLLVAAAAYFVAFARATHIRPLVQVQRRWPAGLVGGVLLGAFLMHGVAGQPASQPPEGVALARALVWLGLVYGAVDALLLSVAPVLAVYGSRTAEEMRRGTARLRWGGVALLASLTVTAAYHVGFEQFRGATLLQPLLGNGLVTLSYLLTGNPLAPLLAHVLMHVAAVLHGPGTTIQLPPHY